MSASKSIQRAVRLALLTSAAASSLPLQAADQPISEVVVTGTRIQRPDYESASPVVSLSSEAFERNATLTVETLLNSLPQFVPSVTNTSNNPSNGGQANVELRGLGTDRTLVLLDGKRVIPSNPSSTVDLNLFPPSLIQNIEIISGGASAVYGSDAIAGVVNIKTKDLEGIDFQTNVGQTAESDGMEYQLSLTGGMKFADGRGKLMGNITYSDRESVLAGAREPSRITQGFNPTTMIFAPQGSGTIEEGVATLGGLPQSAINQVFATYGVAPGAARGARYGFNQDGTLFSAGNRQANSVQNFRGTMTDSFNNSLFTYNFAPTNYLQLPLERTSTFVRGSFELSPNAELYIQGLGSKLTVNTQLAPTPGTSLAIPVTNPFIPQDLATLASLRSNPNALISFDKRLTELGPRFEKNETDIYQVLGGVRGNIGATEWTYDVYGSYGETQIDTIQLGSISRSRFEQLTFAADGGASLCDGGLNPFGLGSISQSCADFVRVNAGNTTDVKQTIAEAVFSGPLAKLPAGDLQIAFGAFYKKDEYAFRADEALRANSPNPLSPGDMRADVAGFNAADNVIGSTDSREVYAEALIPIISDAPGIKRLDATLGYRASNFSSAGDVSSYKGEFTYQPVDAFTVRSSYQRAVRAPNIGELFTPLLVGFPALNDPEPCDSNNEARGGDNAAAIRALCIAQGLAPGDFEGFVDPDGQAQGLSGGNPNLNEETADTVTLGFVFRSPSSNKWLANLQASVDFYRINITEAISAIDAATFVDRCFDPAFNPMFSTDNSYCSFFRRDPATGQIVDALELQQNIGAIDTSGIDIQIDWAAEIGPGRLDMNILASYLNKYDRQEVPGDAFTHLEDTIDNVVGSAFPRWKGTVNASYTFSGLSLSTRVRYVNTLTDENQRTFDLPSVTYIDAGASYSLPESIMKGVQLRLGVINLTDKEPLLYPSAIQTNTDPSTYDVLGRRYSFSASFSFR